MAYISLTRAELEGSGDVNGPPENQFDNKKIFRHPVRNRILEILRDGKPHTQQELGKILSMSNAAVHYHVKLMKEIGVIRLHSTRQGPNSITEKLYTIDKANWPDVSKNDVDYYIDYALSWINERNREGLNILKSGEYSVPFLAGSYCSQAPLHELIAFKREMERLFEKYFKKYEKMEEDGLALFAVTFSLLPSRESNTLESRNVLEFEPESATGAA